MVDDAIAIELQDRYLSGDKHILSALYCEVRRMAALMLRQIANGVNRDLTDDEESEMSHDSASRLLSQYLKHPGYRVRNFRIRVRDECLYRLFDGGHQDRPGKKIEREMMPIESAEHVKSGNGNGHEDTTFSFQDIMTEHPRGSQMIIDLFRARSYREAIQSIASYATRRWIFDHAVRLRYVYKHTRRRNAQRANQSKS